jgi:hypothetical protein
MSRAGDGVDYICAGDDTNKFLLITEFQYRFFDIVKNDADQYDYQIDLLGGENYGSIF